MISIITSTLDAAADLPHTLRSVAEQRGAPFEWIVIDGGSRDGTIELLRHNAALIAHWTSEPDAGIYDAWNKALARARGDWLLFVGAGDEFASPGTLAHFAPYLERAHPAHDLVYGRIRYISREERADLEEAGEPWERLAGRWELCRPALPPHPAIFHHRSLFAGRAFDPSYRIAGDAHFLLKHAMRKTPLFVPATVVRTPIGGASMNFGSARAVAREIERMDEELGLVPPLAHRAKEKLLLAAKVAAGRLPGGAYLADGWRRLIGQPRRWSVR